MNDVSMLPAIVLEKLLVEGDLAPLNTEERLAYYLKVCESLGLSPITKPFAYIKLNGKLQLYPLKSCAEQLRKIHKISVFNMHSQLMEDEIYLISAEFRTPDGRTDQATGAVSLKGLTGEARSNKMMTAETKCKNRGTYSILGLGMLDETEIQSIQEIEASADRKHPRLRGAKAVPVPDAEPRTMIELDVPAEAVAEPVGDGSGEAGGSVEGDAAKPPERAGRPADAISTDAYNAFSKAISDFANALGVPDDWQRARIVDYCAREFGIEHLSWLNNTQLEKVLSLMAKGRKQAQR